MGGLKIEAAAILNEDNPEFFDELMKKGVDAVEPEMNKQRSERNRKEWINDMVKELNTEEKLRADLEVYYGLIQVNQKVIYMLSNGLLSKPNYIFEVFEEMFQKRLDEVRDANCVEGEQ